MEEKLLKGGLAALGTILAMVTESYGALITLLVFFEIGDYITGMYVAYRDKAVGGWSSGAAIHGFFKKLFYFFLVAVGFGFDYMILEVSHILGMDFEYQALFGVLALCYLLSTELISILENLAQIGIEVPFLSAALKVFRERIGKKGHGE